MDSKKHDRPTAARGIAGLAAVADVATRSLQDMDAEKAAATLREMAAMFADRLGLTTEDVLARALKDQHKASRRDR